MENEVKDKTKKVRLERTFAIVDFLEVISSESYKSETYSLTSFCITESVADLSFWTGAAHKSDKGFSLRFYCKDEYKEDSVCKAHTFSKLSLKEKFTPDEFVNKFWRNNQPDASDNCSHTFFEDFSIFKNQITLYFKANVESQNICNTIAFRFYLFKPFFETSIFSI